MQTKASDFANRAQRMLGTPGYNPGRPDAERQLLSEFRAFDSDEGRKAALDALLPKKGDAYLGDLVRAMEKVVASDPAAIARVDKEIAAVQQQSWHSPGGEGWSERRSIYDYWAHGVDAPKPSSMSDAEFAAAQADVKNVSKINTAARELGIPYRDPWSHTVRD